ncbi:MAG: hypothetical protein LBR32_05675 [Propionibacteriaceae bacterium]|jgi:hypothetical protein|nr:hypothetical protein [Propionibacteriaceae bacterium]
MRGFHAAACLAVFSISCLLASTTTSPTTGALWNDSQTVAGGVWLRQAHLGAQTQTRTPALLKPADGLDETQTLTRLRDADTGAWQSSPVACAAGDGREGACGEYSYDVATAWEDIVAQLQADPTRESYSVTARVDVDARAAGPAAYAYLYEFDDGGSSASSPSGNLWAASQVALGFSDLGESGAAPGCAAFAAAPSNSGTATGPAFAATAGAFGGYPATSRSFCLTQTYTPVHHTGAVTATTIGHHWTHTDDWSATLYDAQPDIASPTVRVGVQSAA